MALIIIDISYIEWYCTRIWFLCYNIGLFGNIFNVASYFPRVGRIVDANSESADSWPCFECFLSLCSFISLLTIVKIKMVFQDQAILMKFAWFQDQDNTNVFRVRIFICTCTEFVGEVNYQGYKFLKLILMHKQASSLQSLPNSI